MLELALVRKIWRLQGGRGHYFFSVKHKDSGKWKDIESTDFDIGRWPNREWNLYFCPLGFSSGAGRQEENVLDSILLWSDIDEADPRKMGKLKPQIAWESSPGRYAGLWILPHRVKPEDARDLSRRLAYGIGADKAGWDLTQVLRVPGGKNHKYPGSPEGRTLWANFDERLDPEDVPTEHGAKSGSGKSGGSGEISSSKAKAIELYRKYEKRLPPWVRRLLTDRTAEMGKRSEVLWKLWNGLFDGGVKPDDMLVLVKECVWNKFKGRRNEDKQLRREMEKVLGDKLGGEPEADEGPALAGARSEVLREGFVRMSQVKRERIDWLWPGYIPRGMLTILEGDPGIGKSYLMHVLGKMVADGDRFPGQFGGRATGSVLYFTTEDDPNRVIKPRLEDNGLKNEDGFILWERAFEMDDDTMEEVIETAIKEKSALIVFDLITSYIGGKEDTMNAGNVITVKMQRFKDIAQRSGAAVIVLRHLRKGKADKSIYQGIGSQAFAGTARVVLRVEKYEKDDEHDVSGYVVLGAVKMNIGPKPKSVTYRILSGSGKHAREITKRLREGRVRVDFAAVEHSRLEWGPVLDASIDDVLASNADSSKEKGTPTLDKATRWLESKLANGKLEAKKLFHEAETRSICGADTLRRAAKDLGVIIEKRGFPGQVYWSL